MMNTRMMLVTVTLLGILVGSLLSTGCNTWKGAGKDVERAGEKMQGE
jgi:predicted small secreted protein